MLPRGTRVRLGDHLAGQVERLQDGKRFCRRSVKVARDPSGRAQTVISRSAVARIIFKHLCTSYRVFFGGVALGLEVWTNCGA